MLSESDRIKPDFEKLWDKNIRIESINNPDKDDKKSAQVSLVVHRESRGSAPPCARPISIAGGATNPSTDHHISVSSLGYYNSKIRVKILKFLWKLPIFT